MTLVFLFLMTFEFLIRAVHQSYYNVTCIVNDNVRKRRKKLITFIFFGKRKFLQGQEEYYTVH